MSELSELSEFLEKVMTIPIFVLVKYVYHYFIILISKRIFETVNARKTREALMTSQ